MWTPILLQYLSFFEWLNEPYEIRVKRVINLQRFRSKIMDIIARVATFCSDEEFYLITLPVLFWGPYCDEKLGLKICICVGVGLPIGNILKNIYCTRRPTSPLIWHYHTSNEEHEFAFPSTHAILASSVSLLTAFHHIYNYPSPSPILTLMGWLMFAILWSCCVSCSRVYMGAHSFQDIVAGGIIGTVFGLLLFYCLNVYEFILSGPYWFLTWAIVILVILHLHPIDKTTSLNFHLSEGTFDYTSPLLGLTLGAILSYDWINNTRDSCNPNLNIHLLTRFLYGGPLSVGVYLTTKKLLPRFIQPLLKQLKVNAHYINYSDFPPYLSNEIKKDTTGELQPQLQPQSQPQPQPQPQQQVFKVVNGHSIGEVTTDGQGGSYDGDTGVSVGGSMSGGMSEGTMSSSDGYCRQNVEFKLAWGRIYAKLLVYVILTFTVVVVIPTLALERIFQY